VVDQAALSFGGLLRQLRAEARLTQEELAEAAGVSPRSVSDLERGINRTARKDTAELLAGPLGLDGAARESFVAAARGRGPAGDVLAARDGETPGVGHRGARGMPGCPYRGLLPFGESDAGVFYGRERLAAELAAKLAARAAGGGLVVITGASGAGKSSLLRAGLLPILARGRQIPESGRWPRIVMTPTKDPLTELAARLAAVGGPDALAVRDGLARHPGQAHLAIRSAVLAAAARDAQPPAPDDSVPRLVLIMDQFEQVFTLNPDLGGEATRRAFITALCSAAANPVGSGLEPPALVVIAVRGDFWDRCAAVPELVSPLQDGQFVVGPMTESELRVAITGPAAAAGLRIDPALTDTILGDLRAAGADGSAGVLPLLSQAMALTWEQRDGDRLTSHGYAQAGGVSHAVQTGADRVYDTLSAGQQAVARDMLRSMTVASRDGTLARRPASRDDLYAGLPGAARADIDAVLDAFAAERLAVLDGDTAQLSHDVLLRAWPRLRGWLEEDQASWVLYSQLADAALAWHDSDDDPSFLYRGAQLAALQQAVTRWSAHPARSPVLTGTQRGFLQASERAAVRSSSRRRSAFAVLALLTVLALVASGVAFYQRAAAVQQRDQAVYNQMIAEALQFGTTNTTLAAQLTLAAYRIQPTQDLVSRLLNTENTPLSSPLGAGAESIYQVAFSAAGQTLASGYTDGTIRLWDVADPAHPRALGRPLTGGSGTVETLAFSSEGHMLASSDDDGTIRLWDVADPAHPRPLGRPLTGGTGIEYAVAFAPGGHTLASSSADGKVQLWDVADPAHPRPLGRPLTDSTAVLAVAFSPDGQTLASSDFDGAIRLWDVADPAQPRPLGPPLTSGAAAVYSIAFSPGGHTLASGSLDGTVRLWDVADPTHPQPLGPPLTGSTAVVAVAFSPDGHTLASGSSDDTVQLWDVADPVQPRPLGQPLTAGTGTVYSVAFSPSRQTLAIGGSDGTVRLWDVADPAHPRPLGPPLTGGAAAVYSVAFSPGGHMLASGSLDGTVRLWDVADPAHPQPLGPPLTSSAVVAVAFSPDGHVLASGGADGKVQLWDVADPAHPRLLGQPLTGSATVVSVAFSPDGQMLASGGSDGTVRLWDVADPAHPRLLGQPLTGGATGVYLVAFSPDGRTLASSSADGTVRLWNLNVQYAIQRICATAGSLTPQQWNQYIPQLDYQPSCAD
jgi:WD40 repeat protein/DNA-binding XRE family transcriptional regulator